jgi:hypothetical protein
MVPFHTFVVFIAFVSFIVFKVFCIIGAYSPVISSNGCELGSACCPLTGSIPDYLLSGKYWSILADICIVRTLSTLRRTAPEGTA